MLFVRCLPSAALLVVLVRYVLTPSWPGAVVLGALAAWCAFGEWLTSRDGKVAARLQALEQQAEALTVLVAKVRDVDDRLTRLDNRVPRK